MSSPYPAASPCVLCHQPVSTDAQNVLAFESIEVAQPDFEVFAERWAHVTCLSAWPRRDEFIAAWNEAMGEYYTGKELYVDHAGRVTYTDSSNWGYDGPGAERRHEKARLAYQAEREARRDNLQRRMDSARLKAISLGLAGSADVDEVISNMSAEEFHRHFGQFKVSRPFFRKEE